jgi:hypothetical protein
MSGEAFATFGGVYVVSGDLTIPTYGAWSASINFAADDDIPANGNLVIGDLVLRGHVYRQSPFAGSRQALVVAGAGGWLRSVEARHYKLSSGVRKSLLLQDAAAEVGETVNVTSSEIVGNDYVRSKGPASRVLRELAGANWYIDTAGVTQLGAWPSKSIASPFVVINQWGGEGKVHIATENYADWLPNASFASSLLSGTFTVNAVRYTFQDDGTARLEVLT